MDHLKILSFTPLVSSTSGLSLHSTVMLIMSQYIINYCDKTFESMGDRSSTVVKVLRYKLQGCWFDPRWCHGIFH
jgi:hypothetical protein